MAVDAQFQLYRDSEANYRFQLVAADGTVMLTSGPYREKSEAITGIAVVRDTARSGDVIGGDGLPLTSANAR